MRLRAALRRDALVVNAKRLRRVMCTHGLCADVRTTFRIATTDSQHGFTVFPNVLPTVSITGPNQVCAADLTYSRIATGFGYLAVLLNLFSRKVIGWALVPTLHREVCCARSCPLHWRGGNFTIRLRRAGLEGGAAT